MIKEVFKVVYCSYNNTFKSATYPSIADSFLLDYKIGQTTFPPKNCPNALIYAFDNYESAKRFVKCGITIQFPAFLLCEASVIKEDRLPFICDLVHVDNFLYQFWNYDIPRHYSWRIKPAPAGTKMCEWIKPIKVIG